MRSFVRHAPSDSDLFMILVTNFELAPSTTATAGRRVLVHGTACFKMQPYMPVPITRIGFSRDCTALNAASRCSLNVGGASVLAAAPAMCLAVDVFQNKSSGGVCTSPDGSVLGVRGGVYVAPAALGTCVGAMSSSPLYFPNVAPAATAAALVKNESYSSSATGADANVRFAPLDAVDLPVADGIGKPCVRYTAVFVVRIDTKRVDNTSMLQAGTHTFVCDCSRPPKKRARGGHRSRGHLLIRQMLCLTELHEQGCALPRRASLTEVQPHAHAHTGQHQHDQTGHNAVQRRRRQRLLRSVLVSCS